jgi:hypothetical protein
MPLQGPLFSIWRPAPIAVKRVSSRIRPKMWVGEAANVWARNARAPRN